MSQEFIRAQQLLLRSYDALQAIEETTGKTLAELVSGAQCSNETTVDTVSTLLSDLYDHDWDGITLD
mgnify:CR=1 FL=1